MKNPSFRGALVAICVALGAPLALAHDYQAGAIRIAHPWARPTVAGQMAGGGYFKLENRGKTADRLLSVSSTAAERVELHTMKLDGDVMRMRQLDAIELPAGGSVELKPGGDHLMLLGLKAPLELGKSIPLKLTFEKAGDVMVEVKVEKAAAAAAAPAAEHADHHKH
ncbi:MAG: copper chaperone PCu(A)C [Methylibium sp.]|uniref:copper chaperone PCu(A)C n=1 Tax=Methylibium sp. TaxID=2067992 RepID=UPI0017CFE2E8|nr:copper chaperone PCu(A)C [Methylibium sp.]MBA3597892.1 copper chaperone PCu(A)C [Methylibium sp.]